ncbi:MAG: hypothetical protein AB1941_05150 [Gemmatimonadota bacterium]
MSTPRITPGAALRARGTLPPGQPVMDWPGYTFRSQSARGRCRVRVFLPTNGSFRIVVIASQALALPGGPPMPGLPMQALAGEIATDVRRVIAAHDVPVQYVEHLDPLAGASGAPCPLRVLQRCGLPHPPAGEAWTLVTFQEEYSRLFDPARRPIRRSSVERMIGASIPQP